MEKLIITSAIILLISLITSCDNPSIGHSGNKFIVNSIDNFQNSKKLTTYHIYQLNNKNERITYLNIVDSLGKYNIGDTLSLLPNIK